eukprot:1677305-Rhodomonas_salina.1
MVVDEDHRYLDRDAEVVERLVAHETLLVHRLRSTMFRVQAISADFATLPFQAISARIAGEYPRVSTRISA